MSAKPTIRIQTFNRSRLVTALAEHCVSQTVQPFQIIISDDASSDDTLKNLEKFSNDNLFVLSQKNYLE